MGQVLVTESNLSDIADAIRTKNGSSDTYKPSEMAQAILGIGGSSWEQIASAHIGTYSTTSTAAENITPTENLVIPAKTIDDEVYLPSWVIYTVDANGPINSHFLANVSIIAYYDSATTYRTYYTSYSAGYTLHLTSAGVLKRKGQLRANSQYGIYPSALTTGTGVVSFQSKYSASNSGTINGDFYAYAYAIKAPFSILGGGQ